MAHIQTLVTELNGWGGEGMSRRGTGEEEGWGRRVGLRQGKWRSGEERGGGVDGVEARTVEQW